jgi:hypothetical protein
VSKEKGRPISGPTPDIDPASVPPRHAAVSLPRHRLGTRAVEPLPEAQPEPQGPAQRFEQADLIELLWDGPVSLRERFARFHSSNPGVYELLVKITREYIARSGRRRVGIGAVIEQARWWYSFRSTESPKINNSYASFYSRLIMAQEEDLAGVFETRKSTADGDS